ncbi:MAG: DNA topoisomerase VI subunit B [Candidatus Krumholzibacteriota bacterium]|nr:DNA topoisomerase VI subunit B [Candidatus Krumholzibacteriota bacterium]
MGKDASRRSRFRQAGGHGGGVDTLPLFEEAPQSQSARKAPGRADKGRKKGKRTVAAPTKKPPTPSSQRAHQAAQSIASRQREISVSEFFAKNRHMLGFDSPSRAILTVVKEALDNSLDACEEAGLPPDILVEITELSETRYRVVVEDSGPGIVKSHVPKIFGKLLYGSKFHELKQTRGQQGIGISAAVMYSQLTTGKSVKVTTRTGRNKAHLYELQIDTKKNAPVVLDDGEVEWDRRHGTRIDMEIEATYKKGRRSVDAHIHQTALANPHADIRYIPPKGDPIHYERLTDELPPEPIAIKPHPHGVELGVLLEMCQATKQRTIAGFLTSEFSRISSRMAKEILDGAGIKLRTNPKRIKRQQAEHIVREFTTAKIMKPPTSCLSAIGEELLVRSLQREFEADFYTSLTRPPAVYRGNPFQVEVGIAYGVKDMTAEDPVQLYRFANRAPLIYQQSACAITHSVVSTAWKNYGVHQSRGALPAGPLVIMAQIASVWVPFTSESKEAIAHYPEIIKEIRLAVQECGRRLGRYIRKGLRAHDEEKKRSYIEQYIPHIGIALQEILGFSEREEKKIVDKLKDTLERSRKM